jgi:ATP-dependent Clp protease ATP-binding subunit ClpC
VFERFTDGARRAVVLAQEEARLQNRNYIGTEDVLLGLIHQEEGVAAKALESLGISLETVRLQVEEIVAPSSEPPAAGLIPFSPRAKKALELAVRESFQLGHGEVGTEHILMRHRWAPRFLLGWPTWFGNRKASGIRGIPGDLAYLRDSLFKRGDYGA